MLAEFRGHKVIPTLICLLLTTGAPVAARAQTTPDPYVRCSFYPQGLGCEQVYQQAQHDPSPGAASVRNAFEHYARYLKPETSVLTIEDKSYLARNGIRFFDLEKGDIAGLHNVISDSRLSKNPEQKRAEVNAFIAHAVQAELYCGTNDCSENRQSSN